MSVLLKRQWSRRGVLRGMAQGGAVTVGLPLLDCVLNTNGNALASGAPMPVRFGTWFWGLGHSPGYGVSGNAGKIVLGREVAPLEELRPYMNCFDGLSAPTDGKPNIVHYTGIMAFRTGGCPDGPSDIPSPTFDTLIADVIGSGSRFPILNVACSGGPRTSFSARSNGQKNRAEPSPIAFYMQIFGPEFIDPNNADFKPDPQVLVQKSVLSSVNEHAKRLTKTLGAADKERLDAHFTAIRQMELQLALQMEKPPANAACRLPTKPADMDEKEQAIAEADSEVGVVIDRHKIFTDILVMAVACNQTKVFNSALSAGTSGLHKPGEADTHHTLTHIQAIDKKLGYQPDVGFFNLTNMEALAYFVKAFANMREGAGSVLDNTLILAHTDVNDAKTHAIDRLPMFSFGSAGGRVKTGVYIPGNGDSVARVGLTAMQIMGVPIDNWGQKSNQVTKPMREIFV